MTTHPDEFYPSFSGSEKMNFIQKLTLWNKMRKIKGHIKSLEEQREEFVKTLEELRKELVSYINLLYKYGLIDKETLRRVAKKEAKEVLRKLEEERLSYIG